MRLTRRRDKIDERSKSGSDFSRQNAKQSRGGFGNETEIGQRDGRRVFSSPLGPNRIRDTTGVFQPRSKTAIALALGELLPERVPDAG